MERGQKSNSEKQNRENDAQTCVLKIGSIEVYLSGFLFEFNEFKISAREFETHKLICFFFPNIDEESAFEQAEKVFLVLKNTKFDILINCSIPDHVLHKISEMAAQGMMNN